MIKATFCAVAIATILSTAAVTAAPNSQLVNSVQNRLNLYGFSDVDARELTNHQIAALHLKFSEAPGLFGGKSIRFKQEIKVILEWDGSEQF
ncbi:hypothetical protein [Litoreibacter roseus]|uniref:Uncharacterized protein n=1 Tax=Litoreibacter roseus TaxID=2601869 RepID=A0A6N6JGD0_9RHOB|nr:hypothetical protein [Litoreibacter roseus]GFE65027.1 hypothetical protein KIN_21010 [Litoreibacter roseus]